MSNFGENSGSSQNAARSILITGGNRGIGRSIAEAFLASGDKVAVTYRSGDVPSGALGVKADVRDAESLDRAITQAEQEHGPIQVYVANAGITRDTLLLRMSEEDFTEVIDINLTGAFRGVKRVIKGMITQRFGRIIFISSVSGVIGTAGQTNYTASKSAMIGMARSITRELGQRGITANVVAPGFISTQMTDQLSDAKREEYFKNIPVGRFGAAEEVAQATRWLASDEANYIAGAIIPVDGGISMGH